MTELMQTYADNQAAQTYGFAMAPADIKVMAELSHQLLTGTKHYKQVEAEIKQLVSTAFVYREGNKRIVIVSTNQRFVIKIAKMAGFEGIRDNMNEQTSCTFMNNESKFKDMKYAPKVIAVYGTNEYPALVLVQEKHREIFEEIARGLGMHVSEKSLIEAYTKGVCGTGYPTVKKMLDSIASECFISDLPLIRSAGNFSINELGAFAVLDWGSILPKKGYEVRCPHCKAPMVYEVEAQDTFINAEKLIDMNVIKPVYKCIANDSHILDPDTFFAKLTAGDQTVIMTLQEAQQYVAQLQQQKAQQAVTNTDAPTQQQYNYNGQIMFVGSKPYPVNGIEYRRLFMSTGQPSTMFIGSNGQVAQFSM
jgi:hypothetical protein